MVLSFGGSTMVTRGEMAAAKEPVVSRWRLDRLVSLELLDELPIEPDRSSAFLESADDDGGTLGVDIDESKSLFEYASKLELSVSFKLLSTSRDEM